MLFRSDDCDVAAQGQDKNVGCSIAAPSQLPGANSELPSYGTSFNAGGGGVYALEWTDSFIQVWFFPRNSPTFPATDQLTVSPDPSSWGNPLAKFQGSGCDFSQRFKDQRIIFNVAFCGDWAGSDKVWSSGCAAKTGVEKCDDYVRDNPDAFKEVYWEIAGLRWFDRTGGDEDQVAKKMDAASRIVHRHGREYRW